MVKVDFFTHLIFIYRTLAVHQALCHEKDTGMWPIWGTTYCALSKQALWWVLTGHKDDHDDWRWRQPWELLLFKCLIATHCAEYHYISILLHLVRQIFYTLCPFYSWGPGTCQDPHRLSKNSPCRQLWQHSVYKAGELIPRGFSPSPPDHSHAVPSLFQLNSESLHFGLQEIFGVVNPILFGYRYSERRPINQKKKKDFSKHFCKKHESLAFQGSLQQA